MNSLIKSFAAAILFVGIASLALDALAADVRADISTRETYVGMPITFRVQISNATDFDPPTVPEIPGLRIQSVGEPARSTQITTINGQTTTRSSVTYAFAVTPLQPGSFRIPAITIRADGQTLATRPIEFVASKSETGDLLFVEVAGKEKQIYVGQSLDLTLKIWVRPYRDKDHNITLSEADMWQLLSQQTSWGAFTHRIQQLAGNRERPVGNEVLREDRDGASHSYYLYEVDATIYPKKPGRIDASDVQVVLLYPTALGQSRDPFESFFNDMGMAGRGSLFDGDRFSPFGARLTVESVRPVVAEAKVEPIEVVEIPTADRPADYRGAVGKYRIVAQATPSDVQAGDPITLLLGIAGTGPMELVQAPPLTELPTLTQDFKVPNELLAGYVEGARKVFSTTIRPRKEGITQIPSIPFTYFDPEVREFVTAESEPITIHVSPADTLALDAVVGRSKVGAGGKSLSSADGTKFGPVLTNFTGDEMLTSQTPAAAMLPPMWLVVVLPPVIVLVVLLVRGRSGAAILASRFRSASRKCRTDIENATQSSEIGAALCRFLAKRFALGAAADSMAVVGALRADGYRSLAVRCERLLEQCDQDGSVLVSGARTLDELKQDAVQMIEDWASKSCRPRRLVRPSRVARRRAVTSATIAALAVATLLDNSSARAAGVTNSAGTEASAISLTREQQQTVLIEANEQYQCALDTAADKPADAKQAFADAAQKYQLLVDSGVRNSRLYFNLANAYLESGQTGRAIANYRRSLALDPTNRAARTNLAYAEGKVSPATTESNLTRHTVAQRLSAFNNWLTGHIGPHLILAMAILGWFTCWTCAGLRLVDVRFPWKSVGSAALALTAVTAISYLLTCQSLNRPIAVVVSSDAVLRTGDGEHFPAASNAALAEGQYLDYVRGRGDWMNVRTHHGHAGWLPSTAVEAL